jgi:hypothetical protein
MGNRRFYIIVDCEATEGVLDDLRFKDVYEHCQDQCSDIIFEACDQLGVQPLVRFTASDICLENMIAQDQLEAME